ncbi:MAG: hypothetical protein QM775_30005 [Pirellulales bacterium]
MERVIFQFGASEIAERIWPSAPRPRDLVSLKNVADRPQSLFLVERVTWQEQDDGGRIPIVSIIRLDRSGSMVVERPTARIND